MSARQSEPLGLARAQQRIEGLLDELNRTVDEVEQLTHTDPERALRLVEDQRRSLSRFVTLVASDVGPRRSRFGFLRAHARVAGVLATVAFVSVGMAMGWLRVGATSGPAPLAAGPATRMVTVDPADPAPAVTPARPTTASVETRAPVTARRAPTPPTTGPAKPRLDRDDEALPSSSLPQRDGASASELPEAPTVANLRVR